MWTLNKDWPQFFFFFNLCRWNNQRILLISSKCKGQSALCCVYVCVCVCVCVCVWERERERGRKREREREREIFCRCFNIKRPSVSHSISRVWLFATPWTVAHQSPLSMEFSRRKYWSGLLFPSPGDLLVPGVEPSSSTFQAYSLLDWATREAL